MLTHKLIHLIQYHSENLAASLVREVQMCERAGSYRNVSPEELKQRVFEIYHHVGEWLLNKSEADIEKRYIAIGAGPCNDAVEIDAARIAGSPGGEIDAHFRSEDARLCAPDEATENCLVLRGEIVQCSYPGGFYRYAVRVGAHQYLVDDARRLAIGNAVGIALPASALHFYAAPTNVP